MPVGSINAVASGRGGHEPTPFRQAGRKKGEARYLATRLFLLPRTGRGGIWFRQEVGGQSSISKEDDYVG